MSDKEKLKSISKRIMKAIDNEEDDLLYVLFDIQDIIQDDEETRLNNIINELEEIINYEIQEWKNTDDELMKARVQEDKHILEVIEGLKENNKDV